MTTRTLSLALGLLTALALTAGCQQPAHDMQAGPPPRPAELDRLESWAGTWTGTGECTIHTPEGPQKCNVTGTEYATWTCDKRFLMSNCEYDMGGEIGKMTGISMVTWDAKGGKYRSWWFDSMGTCAEGTMSFDEKNNCWTMKSKGHNPMTGEPTCGEGSFKVSADGRSMEWTMTEWDSWKLKKSMEMKGTSTKQ